MIYDYQDLGTKYYLTSNVRDWVGRGNNAILILQNPKVKELTEADLSWNSDDDIVWTVMYLIGVGLLRYVVTGNGQFFSMGVNLNWRKPPWLNNPESRKNLNSHIDYLMEIEREGRKQGLQPTALIASLEVSKYGKICVAAPKEPVRDDLVHEQLVIAKNKQRMARKRAFHRGRTK